MVAVAMTCSSATRNPPTSTGSASGSSTRVRIWRFGQAHAAGRFLQVRVDLLQPGVGRHQDGRDGQQHHGQEDGEEA